MRNEDRVKKLGQSICFYCMPGFYFGEWHNLIDEAGFSRTEFLLPYEAATRAEFLEFESNKLSKNLSKYSNQRKINLTYGKGLTA